MITITVKKEMDFHDLLNESWSGAKRFLEEVQQAGKEDELMDLLADEFGDDGIDQTSLNDEFWFNDDYWRELLGMTKDND